MVSELALNGEAARMKADVAARLLARAPRGTKCVFLNCELRDSQGGMAMSDVLFAVVKPLFGQVDRVTLDLDVETFDAIAAFGRELAGAALFRGAVLDLIISAEGGSKCFLEDGPLIRLSGKDRSFKTKHRVYAQVEPWLAEVT
jgi:hypothetical protein